MLRRAFYLACFFLVGAAIKFWLLVPEPMVVKGRLGEGAETQLILLASPTCKACQSPEFADLMGTVLRTLRDRTWGDDGYYSSVFVGIGAGIDEQLKLAKRYGEFDEMVVGHGWANMGAMRYVWQDMPSEGATPNLVLTRRSMAYNEFARGIAPAEESVLVRLIGIEEIQRWVSNGLPVP